MVKKLIVIAVSMFLCQSAYAKGGVALAATRVIYPINEKQVTLKVSNSDNEGKYLIQSWVTDFDGKKTTDFVITPPLFKLNENSNNILRIIYTGNRENLPKDRETLFYFHSKSIPSTGEVDTSKSALLISTTSKIKLFMRPSHLKPEEAMESYKKLKCSYQNGQIKIENPTPFYMNLVDLKVNGKEVSSASLVPPMDSVLIKKADKGSSLVFDMISDYGSRIKAQVCAL